MYMYRSTELFTLPVFSLLKRRHFFRHENMLFFLVLNQKTHALCIFRLYYSFFQNISKRVY